MDFCSHLARQLSFLQHSCQSYDNGDVDEAIRMATVIRVLIHDTNSSTSLLKHLNATKINLLSTTSDIPPNTDFAFGLGMLKCCPDGSKYVASLGFGPINNSIPVSQWWDEVVFALNKQTRLSRGKIVLSAANQDGGAHVDTKLSREYEALSADGALGHFVHEFDGESVLEPIADVHLVAIRQMAYELLNSPKLNALL